VPQGPSRQRGEQLLRASWLMEQAAVDLKAALKPIGGLAAAQQRVQDFASTLAAAGQELAQQQAPQQGPEQALAAAGQCLLHGAQSAQEILQPAGAQALHILGTQVQAAAAQMRAAGAAPSLRGAKGLLSVAAGRLHGAGACLLGVPAEEQCVPGAWPPELRKRLPGVVRALLAAQQRLGRAGSKLLRGARSLARHLFAPSTTAAFKRDHVMLTDTTIVVRRPSFVCDPNPGRGTCCRTWVCTSPPAPAPTAARRAGHGAPDAAPRGRAGHRAGEGAQEAAGVLQQHQEGPQPAGGQAGALARRAGRLAS
jgi:hypothetical protein